MNFIEIKTDQAASDLEQGLKSLYPGDARKAVNRSINKALGKANTQANREIRSIYNIALKDLNDRDNKLIKPSSENTLTGTINASESPLSLSKFDPVWIRTNRRILNRVKGAMLSEKAKSTVKRGKGFRVTTNASEGVTMEIIKGNKVTLPSAFMLFRKGGTPVMARGQYSGASGFIFGKSRLPITKLNTKSVFFSMRNSKVENRMSKSIANDYPEELKRQLALINKHITGY
jgi:hypothetical protein